LTINSILSCRTLYTLRAAKRFSLLFCKVFKCHCAIITFRSLYTLRTLWTLISCISLLTFLTLYTLRAS
jgi:hypothetical protein